MLADIAHIVTGLMIAGVGLIFHRADPGNRASRVLMVCMVTIGVPAALATPASSGGLNIGLATLLQGLEGLALLAGVEWARLISLTAPRTGQARAAQWLFRSAQIVLLVYTALGCGYVLLFPDYAIVDPEGPVKVRGVEFAVFAPLLGSALGLSGIAMVLVLFLRIDRAERIRLVALMLAAPFLVAALIINDRWEPVTLTIGLLVFLTGLVRYLLIQTRRGQLASQFIAPDVHAAVEREDVEQLMSRQRRELSVVYCDLRGFTAYAVGAPSDAVVDLLERYYETVGRLARRHQATVKDHAGDGVLILVGAPKPVDGYERQAIDLGLALLDEVAVVLADFDPSLGIGVGVATGDLAIGAIQGASRLEYVAVGNAVNLAARLSGRAGNGELLTDTATVRTLPLADFDIRESAPEPLKGFAVPLPVFHVRRPRR